MLGVAGNLDSSACSSGSRCRGSPDAFLGAEILEKGDRLANTADVTLDSRLHCRNHACARLVNAVCYSMVDVSVTEGYVNDIVLFSAERKAVACQSLKTRESR